MLETARSVEEASTDAGKTMESMRYFITDLYRSAAIETFCCMVSCVIKDERDRISGVLRVDKNFQLFCSFDKY
jgi:hypothetical protein